MTYPKNDDPCAHPRSLPEGYDIFDAGQLAQLIEELMASCPAEQQKLGRLQLPRDPVARERVLFSRWLAFQITTRGRFVVQWRSAADRAQDEIKPSQMKQPE